MNKLNLKRLLLLIFICIPLKSFCQEDFMAGAARESLQPGKESISLALAGYGAPRDGRFTLDWEKKDDIHDNYVLSGIDSLIFAVDKNGDILKADIGIFPLRWSSSSHSEKAIVPKSLTGEKDNLFLLDTSGDIYHKAGNEWLKAGVGADLKEIVLFNNILYGLGDNGAFKKAEVASKRLKWQTFARLPEAVSFVIHHHLIYAATGTDTLWKMNMNNPDAGWIKAGYNNGVITNVSIKKLILINDKLHAINEEGELYEAVKNNGAEPEELFASALAIRKRGKTIVLLGLDLCGFDAKLAKEVRQELYQKRGLPASAVLINASHTHFSPVTQAWPTWGPHNQYPDSNYLNKVVKPAIVKAAERALDNMKPSNIYFGRGKTKIGYNRSNGGNPSPYDDAVDVIRVESIDGNKNFLMVLAGCHPVAGTAGKSNFTISSNYPGYMRNILEKTTKNTFSMFIQGCGGDINPRDEQPEVTGMKLAIDVLQVLNNEMKLLQGDISFSLDTLKVPATPWDPKKIKTFRKDNLGHKDVSAEKNVRWANLMLEKYDKGIMPEHLPVYIQTVNIGDWKLVGLSREVVTEYSIGIKKIWPDKMVSVAGYCNDVSSYLPVERHIRTGVYEGFGSFLWYGQPSAFPENIFDLLIEHIKNNNNSRL
jgi:hypothetical protein